MKKLFAVLALASLLVFAGFGARKAVAALGFYDIQYSNAIYHFDLANYLYYIGDYYGGDHHYFGHGLPFYYAHLAGYNADYWCLYAGFGDMQWIFRDEVLYFAGLADHYWLSWH